MILQNIQNISAAVQELLKVTDTASVKVSGLPLLWKKKRIIRGSIYIMSRAKELEGTGTLLWQSQVK